MAVSELKRIGRAAFVVGAVVVGISASSCGEFVRNNPFDPAVPVTLTIRGPDSAFAQFDTLRFTVTTDPVYDYDDVQWESGGLQKIDNNGMYQVAPISVYNGRPTTVPITVRIGTRTATKNVYIDFKPVGIRVRFCNDGSRAVNFTYVGQSAAVCVSTLDARGGVISTAQYPALPAKSLDTTVARIAPNSATIVAAGGGTTGIVFTSGSAADTVTVTVRQVVTSLTVSPALCWSTTGQMVQMNVGDTLRLKLGPTAYDLTNNPITDPTIVQPALAATVWESHPDFGDVQIGITSDGLVTATTPGRALLRAVLAGSNAPQNYVASCQIQVN